MTRSDALFARLLDLNREAFAALDYGTAYQLLVAALHRALFCESAVALAVVAERAGEQWDDLARPGPGHGLTRLGLRHRREEYAGLAQLAVACTQLIRRTQRPPTPPPRVTLECP